MNRFFLLITLILFSCVCTINYSKNSYVTNEDSFSLVQRNSFTDSTIISKNFNAIEFDEITFKDVLVVDCSFINCDFTNSSIFQSVFDKCTLVNKEYLHNIKFDDVTINESNVDLAFSNSTITRLRITNSAITELKFLGCKIDTLEIRYSEIKSIHFVNNEINSMIIIGEVVDKILLDNNIASNIQMVSFKTSNFKIKGGQYTYLNIDDIETHNTLISMQDAILSYPAFSINSIKYIDLVNISSSESNLKLKLEKDTDENKYSPNQSRNNYLEARNIYSVMRSQFAKYYIDDVEKELNYKIHLIDRKLKNSSLIKIFDYLFNDILRGGYGLYPGRVLLTSLYFLLFFSFVYYLLGRFRIGWSFLIYTDGLGNVYENSEPIFMDIKDYSFFQFSMLCFIFSFEQLMIIGFRAFEISSLLKGFKYSPSYFIPVGIGRRFATFQNIIGLILLVSFVQAFINSV